MYNKEYFSLIVTTKLCSPTYPNLNGLVFVIYLPQAQPPHHHISLQSQPTRQYCTFGLRFTLLRSEAQLSMRLRLPLISDLGT